jgi:hypothetical protein
VIEIIPQEQLNKSDTVDSKTVKTISRETKNRETDINDLNKIQILMPNSVEEIKHELNDESGK